jgi:hypothetical protein
MADEAAVLDAPVEDVVEESLVDTAEPAAEGAEPVEGDQTADLKGSKLWRDVNTKLTAGEKLTPKEMAAIRRSIHFEHNHQQKYPNGVQELESTREAIQPLLEDETMPIGDAIQQIAQERTYFRELDSLFTAGKPEFVAKIADASPESFLELAPTVFQKFSEMNNEGFSSYVTGSVLSYMAGQKVPLQYEVLRTFLPQIQQIAENNPNLAMGGVVHQIVGAFNALYKTQQSLEALAAKPINKPFTAKTEDRATESGDANTLQMENNALKWDREADGEALSFIGKEAAKLAGKTALSTKEMTTVRAKVSEELDARLSMNKQYVSAMKGYLTNGNRTAYLQRLKSERLKILPGAIRRAVADVADSRPKVQKPVPGTTPNGKPANNVQTKVNVADPNAFRRISAYPKGKVDRIRTTQKMLNEGKAYLIGEERPVIGPWGLNSRKSH